MEFDKAIILALSGLVAGFINTVAGGGSLLTLPIFIFLGFEANVANATNRVAIFSQNIAAIAAFKNKGYFNWRFGLMLGISALFGAIIGSNIAVDIKGDLFNKILGIVMLLVGATIVLNPLKNNAETIERMANKHKWISTFVFFFIGIYGGFIQAGTGFLILGCLSIVNRLDLVKSNSLKVFVAFTYTISALAVFIWAGLVDWKYGLCIAAGQSIGGWVGSNWSVNKGDVWIRRILLLMIGVMSLKLLGAFDFLFAQLSK